MNVVNFVNMLECDFFTGVPDSQLKPLCDFLLDKYGTNSKNHIIAANEGNCVGLAAGYHLATAKVPVVYLQNSGEGNIINPVASLLNDQVYGIPVIFIIGWRGEPEVHDEPQHIYQGKITLQLLQDMEISYTVLDKETSETSLIEVMNQYREQLKQGKSVAFVVRKDALVYEMKMKKHNEYTISREAAIQQILKVSDQDPIVSTTGKASRELYELRDFNGQEHKFDFLTVGSMGHSSSIALGVALNSNKKVWCIDGDGAVLMHMGAMAVIGANCPSNLIHILINNEAHDTVGGMPTVAKTVDFPLVAKACQYPYVSSVDNLASLKQELLKIKNKKELCFLEIKCTVGARADLGRPKSSTEENKRLFMEFLMCGEDF